MTRSELISRLHRRQSESGRGLRHVDVERVAAAFLDEMSRAIASGGRVELRDFGVFSSRLREARMGRNPRTGATVEVSARRIATFRAGRRLRMRLNGLSEESS